MTKAELGAQVKELEAHCALLRAALNAISTRVKDYRFKTPIFLYIMETADKALAGQDLLNQTVSANKELSHVSDNLKLPWTRAQLDQLRCPCGGQDCGDTRIFLKGPCCESSNEVFYDRAEGTLTLRCARCKKEVVKVKVASGLIEA